MRAHASKGAERKIKQGLSPILEKSSRVASILSGHVVLVIVSVVCLTPGGAGGGVGGRTTGTGSIGVKGVIFLFDRDADIRQKKRHSTILERFCSY